jgi:hypothetical protein
LRDQLKAGLSATAQMKGDDAGPTVSELAEKIKALKAAHNIEAAPQRVRQKQSSAEEPVTARIRRRTKVVPAAESAIQTGVAALPAESEQNSSIKPQMTFQGRITMERQRKDQEPSLIGNT